MSQIGLGSINKALTPGVMSWFGEVYDRYGAEYKEIFEEKESNRYYEELVSLTGLSLAVETGDGGATTYDDVSQHYVQRIFQENFRLGFIITRNMIDFNQYAELAFEKTARLANSIRETDEHRGANVLNNAFDSAFTGGDGKELCATDHPLGGGGTFSNELSTAADLSEAALEQALIDINDFVDEAGLRVKVKAKKLIVPNELQFEACRLLKSEYRPDTANNDVNAIYTTMYIPEGYTTNHYLTDADAWFIKTNAENGLTHIISQQPEFSSDVDMDTDNIKYKVFKRDAFDWGDPRTLFGSPGA